MLKTLCITLFLVFSALCAYAQTGSITGTLQSSTTHAAISGAAVSIVGQSVTTDSTGHFVLTGLSAGTYTVTFSATGYLPYRQSVSVATGSSSVDMGAVGVVGSVEPIGFKSAKEVAVPLLGVFIMYGIEGVPVLVSSSTKGRRRKR